MLFKVPPFFKSYYFLFTASFLVWMLFFDSNDFINQIAMRNKLEELKDEKAYYEEKIIEVKEERQNLLSNRHQLEKFARENYLMKKRTEDVYIIQKEQ